MRRNDDIRSKAKEQGIYLWEIAERLGMTDTYFSKMLRYELTEEYRDQIFVAIEEIRRERKG